MAMNKQAFEAKREQFTAALAAAFAAKINDLGEDVRGVTWFSSNAEEHMSNRIPLAA